MGKLRDVLCVAANKESLFVAGYYRNNLVLVKSDPYPTSLASAKWELLTTGGRKNIDSEINAYPDTVQCAAGDDGSFLLLYDTSEFHTLFYDPSSQNGWSGRKSGRGACGRYRMCMGNLLSVPGTSPSQFKYVYNIYTLNEPSPTVNVLYFMKFVRSSNLLILESPRITLEDTRQVIQLAYYKNQMLYLNSPISTLNSTTDFSTSTVHMVDIDDEHLPLQDRQTANVSLPYDRQCSYNLRDLHNAVGNDDLWYLFCTATEPNDIAPQTAFTFDGQTVTKLGEYDFSNEVAKLFKSYSMIPVPSEGAPTWTVAITKYSEDWSRYGIFGMDITKGSFGRWESSDATALSVGGLGLSGGELGGIIVGALAGVAGLAGIVYHRKLAKRRRDITPQKIEVDNDDNA